MTISYLERMGVDVPENADYATVIKMYREDVKDKREIEDFNRNAWLGTLEQATYAVMGKWLELCIGGCERLPRMMDTPMIA